MATYQAPLRDMRFVLYELHGIEDLRSLPDCHDLAADLIDPILDEAARFSEEVLLPARPRAFARRTGPMPPAAGHRSPAPPTMAARACRTPSPSSSTR